MRPTTETPTHDSPPNCVVAEFNAMADTFDTRHFLRISAHRLVDCMTLPAGAQVLDVATGTGWAALAAAQRVGPTGSVGIDLAPALLERAKQKAAAAGLTQVAFRTGGLMWCSAPRPSFLCQTCWPPRRSSGAS